MSSNFTNPQTWEDMSKIMYSPYYAAMAHRQHGSGIMTEKEFLMEKIELAKAIFQASGGRDASYLEMLLTADSLATTPYGFGGKNIISQKYQYDHEAVILKIAQELKLSDRAQASLDKTNPTRGHMEEGILFALRHLLEGVDVLSPEVKKEYVGFMTNPSPSMSVQEFKKHLATVSAPADQAERIMAQEEKARFVVSQMNPNTKNPLKYLLGTKEKDFAQLIPDDGTARY